MRGREIRTGFVGAGYIAPWHAEALASVPGTRLVAVCDTQPEAAAVLAAAHGAASYAGLERMLAVERLDAVHVLTPPHLHRDHALAALQAGAHVLLEKPFALSRAEADEIVRAAENAGRIVAVNHNFLALPSYRRLRRLLEAGDIGRVDRADVRWHFPLAPLRSGPFGLWMLRQPQNLLMELGPHLYAFAEDLFGPMRDVTLHLSKPIDIPGGGRLPQVWTILGRAGVTDITLSLSLVEAVEDRSVSLRGVAAAARLDFGADTLIVERPNASDIVLNPLRAQLALAGQHLVEGLRNGARQAASLNRKSPYALGFRGMLTEFHAAVGEGRAIAPRFAGATAARVIGAIEETIALLPAAGAMPVAATPERRAASPPSDVLVIGGTGFIGRALVRCLAEGGRRVRVASRGLSNPFADLGNRVEIVPVRLTDQAGLAVAMAGIETVYHLAKATEATWEDYLRNDVAVTERIAGAVLEAGVRRLIYTGTIASYDASDPGRQITEDTPFGPMDARNLYARSKALCEERLLELHRQRGLPLVIARPGIVVGAGGPLQHWGIGRWHGAGAVRIWGSGHNILPFVLNEDVADALLRMSATPAIEGQSFNLVGEPLMTARDYFDAIHAVTGTRIRVVPGYLASFYLADRLKYLLKRYALRRRGLTAPSRADWYSRAHLSPFRNDRAKRVLGWAPEADAGGFARKAVGDMRLFGF
ncbi:MAG TPA: NAD-dependent epimerase/dehydratase family protein [Paracoccaceae bacterium]|nr:NAD-dependent epimerase/dehydratase family protein [Paracoccaceae bacterium]HMO70033.1 NAD-dependent epimerase/dehydratase family protein [Paracoccaceae bacterium]